MRKAPGLLLGRKKIFNGDVRKSLFVQYHLISKWTISELNSSLKSASRQAARVLQRNTKLFLVASHPNATRPNPKWPFTIDQGVRLGKFEKGEINAKVHLLGHRYLAGTHRLKWIAAGTKDRYTKKGQFRGHINPTHFFETAIRCTPIQQILVQACNRAIRRINRRKFGFIQSKYTKKNSSRWTVDL